jgi:hypothetical protein
MVDNRGALMDNVYVRLTHELNAGRLRAILASGQAVVLYRLAIMSKDGDWILREDEESLAHVIATLSRHGARYRFGAPLDLRWLAHGWSSHLEFQEAGLRIRCDFVTRPPRVSPEELAALWEAPVQKEAPVVGLAVLAELKKTNREKDYAVIGELARQMNEPGLALLYSRSARDLMRIGAEHPGVVQALVGRRPLLARLAAGRDEVERLLDEERRALIRRNEERLDRYVRAAAAWGAEWPRLARELATHPLPVAHAMMVARAGELLPAEP